MLEKGQVAPDFTLLDSDGKEVSLSDHKGQWVVLYFYPRDNTSGCTKEACDFTETLPQFQELGCTVLGVSPDSVKSHKKFQEKHGLKVRLLSDPEREVLKAYGAWGKKKNYGKEYEGVIRSTYIIDPDGKVAWNWKNVRVRTKRKGQEVRHADAVLEKLKELETGWQKS
ncbi:MAG: peroxiredoxin [Thermodesulfobacteria bacterium]|nr:peroxiredoxin [Thermodesulfobacteriota bacterium]